MSRSSAEKASGTASCCGGSVDSTTCSLPETRTWVPAEPGALRHRSGRAPATDETRRRACCAGAQRACLAPNGAERRGHRHWATLTARGRSASDIRAGASVAAWSWPRAKTRSTTASRRWCAAWPARPTGSTPAWRAGQGPRRPCLHRSLHRPSVVGSRDTCLSLCSRDAERRARARNRRAGRVTACFADPVVPYVKVLLRQNSCSISSPDCRPRSSPRSGAPSPRRPGPWPPSGSGRS